MGVFEGQVDIFTTYEVELTFTDKLMGGVPKDPKVIHGWLRSKAGIDDRTELMKVAARTMEENGVDFELSSSQIAEMVETDPDRLWGLMEQATDSMAQSKQTNGFKIDSQHGLYIEDRQIKAALKESTNILYAGDRWGKTKKGPRSFVAERLFVEPSRIFLDRTEPDGVELVVGHVTDKAGKRSTLAYHEYVEHAVVTFKLKMLRDELQWEQYAEIFSHMEKNGLGALRSQSYGRFDTTGFEKIA